ncbi:hypothetical protein A3K73_01725 [Candidatus Pacearchaeota archaeon RBG_13_36_9]|nr:MAG: hypothetical protein A3K73_01725 [Candidatus Pacearchaeota archaeon RBG_13_36_9]
MKAIILAGGKGTRMNSKLPKSLVPVRGKPILSYMVDSLTGVGISKFILLTGHKAEQIENFVREKYPNLDIKLVRDPLDHRGSYICSIPRIKGLIDEDIVFMHGDMIYDSELLKKMMESSEKNLVTTHVFPNSTSKDFKARIENGTIKKISVEITGHLLMPLYKFSKESFLSWIDSINNFIKQGKTSVHAEEAIEAYAAKIGLKPLFYDQELCMELDTLEDLRKAEAIMDGIH